MKAAATSSQPDACGGSWEAVKGVLPGILCACTDWIMSQRWKALQTCVNFPLIELNRGNDK